MNIKEYVAAIEAQISLTPYGVDPVELYEPLRYIMSLGGKRLRPAMVLLAADLFEADWKQHLNPALAIEVFHNFTLMHDDIMDQAPLRRGKKTVHEAWGTNTAILSGDVMLVAAYELLSEVEDKHYKQVIRRFSKTAAEVCEGQQMDMMFIERETVSKEEYLEMIRLKTSVLLGFSMELGAILGGANSGQIQNLYSIGENVGLGFQMCDDILDLYADPEKFGKKVGGDILEKKKTWLWLDALEQQGASEFLAFQNNSNTDAAKVAYAQTYFSSSGVKARAEDLAHAYFKKALDTINSLEIDRIKKEAFVAFVNSIQNRES
jgi:geranylgeranyl diphosphate synthase, type II